MIAWHFSGVADTVHSATTTSPALAGFGVITMFVSCGATWAGTPRSRLHPAESAATAATNAVVKR